MSQKFEPACRRMEWLDPFYKSVWEKAFADAVPISGTFELTPRCNFNCRMCYVHLKEEQIPQYGKELPAREWLRIAQEAKEAGTTWLCITGGEPLLHPEFRTIWKELCQMGFFITLQTNASLIQKSMADFFSLYPPRNVKITLYGSDDRVYEAVCRVKKGFQRVDAGIQRLQEIGIPIQLVSTVIRQNEEDVRKMAFYAYLHKLPWLANGSIKGAVRNPDSEAKSVRITEKLEKNREEKIRNIYSKSPIDIERKPCTYCKDYRLGYWVTWNGDMRFCSFMNEPDIKVRDMTFRAAWMELIKYEEALDWPEECMQCEAQKICFKCAGILAAECGTPHQVTEEFCGKIKKLWKNQKGE